jgi:hypothetical protein
MPTTPPAHWPDVCPAGLLVVQSPDTLVVDPLPVHVPLTPEVVPPLVH